MLLAVLIAIGVWLSCFAWLFRRVVVLFAAVEATERIEDNAPQPGRPGSYPASSTVSAFRGQA